MRRGPASQMRTLTQVTQEFLGELGAVPLNGRVLSARPSGSPRSLTWLADPRAQMAAGGRQQRQWGGLPGAWGGRGTLDP